jgi:hypothetical protein
MDPVGLVKAGLEKCLIQRGEAIYMLNGELLKCLKEVVKLVMTQELLIIVVKQEMAHFR